MQLRTAGQCRAHNLHYCNACSCMCSNCALQSTSSAVAEGITSGLHVQISSLCAEVSQLKCTYRAYVLYHACTACSVAHTHALHVQFAVHMLCTACTVIHIQNMCMYICMHMHKPPLAKLSFEGMAPSHSKLSPAKGGVGWFDYLINWSILIKKPPHYESISPLRKKLTHSGGWFWSFCSLTNWSKKIKKPPHPGEIPLPVEKSLYGEYRFWSFLINRFSIKRPKTTPIPKRFSLGRILRGEGGCGGGMTGPFLG